MTNKEIEALLREGQNRGGFGYGEEAIRTLESYIDSLSERERASTLEHVNDYLSTNLSPGRRPYFDDKSWTEFVKRADRSRPQGSSRRGRGNNQKKPAFDKPAPAPAPEQAPEQAPAPDQPVEQNFPAPADKPPAQPGFPDKPRFPELDAMVAQAAFPEPPAFNVRGGRLFPVAMDEVPTAPDPLPEGATPEEIAAHQEAVNNRNAIIQRNAERRQEAAKQIDDARVYEKGPYFGSGGQYYKNEAGQTVWGVNPKDRDGMAAALADRKVTDKLNTILDNPRSRIISNQIPNFDEILAKTPNLALKLFDEARYRSGVNAKPVTEQDMVNAGYRNDPTTAGKKRAYADDNGIRYLYNDDPLMKSDRDPSAKSSITFDKPEPSPLEGLDNPFSERPLEDLERRGIGVRNPVLSGGPVMSPLRVTGPKRADFGAPTRDLGSMRDLEEERRRRSRSYSPDELTGSWSYGAV